MWKWLLYSLNFHVTLLDKRSEYIRSELLLSSCRRDENWSQLLVSDWLSKLMWSLLQICCLNYLWIKISRINIVLFILSKLLLASWLHRGKWSLVLVLTRLFTELRHDWLLRYLLLQWLGQPLLLFKAWMGSKIKYWLLN